MLVTVTWQDYDAVLFDLDGVITPTAEVHMRAWSEMFNAFLGSWDGGGDTTPYTEADYFAHVDGKPRYDGVRDLLSARGKILEAEQRRERMFAVRWRFPGLGRDSESAA